MILHYEANQSKVRDMNSEVKGAVPPRVEAWNEKHTQSNMQHVPAAGCSHSHNLQALSFTTGTIVVHMISFLLNVVNGNSVNLHPHLRVHYGTGFVPFWFGKLLG